MHVAYVYSEFVSFMSDICAEALGEDRFTCAYISSYNDTLCHLLWGLKQEVAHLREYLGIAYVRTPATTRLQKVATRRGR